MKLNELKDNFGARNKFKRVGRGIGSGKGKTSGRGGKGQTARSGVSINGFEGGQMPIHRRLPKRGFTNIFKRKIEVINLLTVEDFINNNKISSNNKITKKDLQHIGLIKSDKCLVKLLSKGNISKAINIEIDFCSSNAISAIEAVGGKVHLLQADKII